MYIPPRQGLEMNAALRLADLKGIRAVTGIGGILVTGLSLFSDGGFDTFLASAFACVLTWLFLCADERIKNIRYELKNARERDTPGSRIMLDRAIKKFTYSFT